MSFSFLVPAFLAGLLALAVPIVIHLSRRQTRDPVPFPSLMFLEAEPKKTDEKRRIHRWPLFLLRSLALLLLVLAFARPFVDREDAALNVPTTGDREVVVLVDRSYSMGLGDRWGDALARANEVVDGLAGGDRGTIVFFDARAETATESTTDRNVLRSALRAAEPGERTTRYAPALRFGARLLASSPMPRHELVVISDFQRGGWDVDGGETASLRLPAGTLVTPIPVSAGEVPANVAVADAEFERTTVEGRERVTVAARLAASADAAAITVPVTLEIDGRPVETRQVALDGSASGRADFSPVTLPPSGAARGTLRIPDDGLAADNAFHFVLSADQRLGVVIVEGPGAAAGSSYFLERALDVGGAPGFRVSVRRGGDLRAADLAGTAVVILNQAAVPAGETGERLKRFVEQGGGLISVLGDNVPGDWSGVLPNVPAAVDRTAQGGVTLGYVDTGHPVFEAFAGPRTGDFGAAHIYRYRPLPSGSFPRVLARFGDGGAALAERPVGSGRLLVWSTTLDAGWNDLALQPVFLPFLHQMVKYAAGHTPPRSWLTVSDPFDVRGLLPPGATAGVLLGPSGEATPIAPGAPIELAATGFHELRETRGGPVLASLAVNVDPTESELSAFDPEEMRTALLAAVDGSPRTAESLGLTLAERERQQSAWWYLIVAAFVFLVAETLLSNRVSTMAAGFFRRREPASGRTESNGNPGLAA